MRLDKKSALRLGLVLGACVTLAWLLFSTSLVAAFFKTGWGLLYPFLLGFILAYLLNIPMGFIEAKLFRGRGGRLRRPLSLTLTLLLVLGALATLLGLLIPELIKTADTLSDNMPGYLQSAQELLKPYASYIPQLEGWLSSAQTDWGELASKAVSYIQSSGLLSSAFGFASSVASGAVSFGIAIIFAGYLLAGKERLLSGLNRLATAYLPEQRFAQIKCTLSLANHIFSAYVGGQVTEAALLALIYFIILLVGGFAYALLLAVLIGFFTLIPVFGNYISAAIGALLLLVASGPLRALIFIAVFIVVQQLDGTFLYPRVVGRSVGLSPIWVLVAVTVGGSLFGLAGILFFIPLSSVAYTLLQNRVKNRLKTKKNKE